MLHWHAPALCPSQEEVVAASLHNASSGEREKQGRPTLSAEAEVSERVDERGQRTWHVLLSTQHGDSRGTREIEAETCEGLAQATAIVLSVALLDLEQDAPPAVTAPEVPVPLHRDPATEHPRPEPSAKRSAGRSRAGELARFSAGAHLGLSVGVLPRLAAGGALSLAWLPGLFRLELDARFWGRQSETVDDTTSGARFSLMTWGARACLTALKHGVVDLSPCLGADLNLVSAQGFGSDSNYDSRGSWPAVTAGALVRTLLARNLALRARVDGQWVPQQPTFVVEEAGTVHTIPTWGMVALFGAEVHFP